MSDPVREVCFTCKEPYHILERIDCIECEAWFKKMVSHRLCSYCRRKFEARGMVVDRRFDPAPQTGIARFYCDHCPTDEMFVAERLME